MFLSLEFGKFSSTALIIVHVSSVINPIVSPEAFLEISVRIQLTRFSVRFEIQIFCLRGTPFRQLGSLLLVSSPEPKSVNLPTRSSQPC